MILCFKKPYKRSERNNVTIIKEGIFLIILICLLIFQFVKNFSINEIRIFGWILTVLFILIIVFELLANEYYYIKTGEKGIFGLIKDIFRFLFCMKEEEEEEEKEEENQLNF